MTLFQYRVEHSTGYADGSLEAADRDAAEKALRAQYVGKYTDDKGKEKSVEISNLIIEEVK